MDGVTEASPNTLTERGSATRAWSAQGESTKTMSEPLTIWEKDSTGNIYTRPGGAGRVSVWAHKANRLRRAKHLTDAEIAAEHFSWLFLASHTAFENDGWNREADEHSKRAQVIHRFATHDQAV